MLYLSEIWSGSWGSSPTSYQVLKPAAMCQAKMKFCKNTREMLGYFTFPPDEAKMFVFFMLNSLNFQLCYCQGNLNISQRCQGTLVNPKCMNPIDADLGLGFHRG